MRGLGKDLGVEAMSLYKHVGRREDLVALLRARVFSSIRLPDRAKTPRRDLEAVCHALWRALVHEEGARFLIPTPAQTSDDDAPESGVGTKGQTRNGHSFPAWLPIVERLLSSLREFIPEPLDRAYAVHALFSFVMGQVVFAGEPAGFCGQRLDDAALLQADFPEIAAMSRALERRAPEVEFELGLRALLDAMEARRGF